MEYLKINKFILRIEPTTNRLFNLFKEGKTEKGVYKEVHVAYGVTLENALKIIAFKESADADIQTCQELIKWQTNKYESLAEKLTDIGEMLWDKISADKPKKIPVWIFIPYYFCLLNYGSLLGVIDFLRGKTITVWEPVRS